MNEQPLSLGLDKYDLNEMDEDIIDRDGSAFPFETDCVINYEGQITKPAADPSLAKLK